MNDEVFLQQFENGTYPLDQWHHRAHIKVAYLYLTRFGLEQAVQTLPDRIRAYNKANQIQDTPTSGYHETVTMAWLRILQATIREHGLRATADEFADCHPQLGRKTVLLQYYSRELIMSARAKRDFAAPDLASLP